MRNWKAVCSAAIFAVGVTSAAHADEWNKLTILTFSGPVDVPGITLPAGTYRFELADPTTSRRVIRVSDKDGTKSYGMFLSMSNQRTEPADKPIVMFQEAAAGAPQAVKVWFYPGETYGYEFVYPHDQALKIAKATHGSVLAMKDDSTASTTEDERMASMKGAEVTRIDENDRPVSTDAELKESSSPRPAVNTTAQSNTTQSNTASQTTGSTAQTASAASQSTTGATTSQTAPTTAAAATTAQPTTAAPTTAGASTARSQTASAAQPATSPRPTTAAQASTAAPTPVGTSGTTGARAGRRSLPRTASELPVLALLSVLSLAGAAGARAFRMQARTEE